MTDLVQEILIAPGTDTQTVEFLRSKLSQADTKSIVIDEGNGTTNFARIVAGTIMGQITSGNRYRPCAGTIITTAGATASSFDVRNADTIYVGDEIHVAGVDSTETVLTVVGLTITATGNVTWLTNDVFGIGDGSDVAAGLLWREVSTVIGLDINSAVIASDRGGSILVGGRVNESVLTGDTVSGTAAMTGIIMD